MQKYEVIQKLSPIEFRRLTGVRKETLTTLIGLGQGIEVMQDVCCGSDCAIGAIPGKNWFLLRPGS